MATTSATRLGPVYGGIAGCTRRAIMTVLAGGECNVGQVVGRFSIWLNGLCPHVKVLERAGLVSRRVRGREHWLRLRRAPLRDAARWLARQRVFWETRLDALEAVVRP